MTETRMEAPAEITRRLADGERLIWWDHPIPALLMRRELNVGLLFGIFFFAFSLFWMSMASRAGGAFFLFGIPFSLVGLWLVSAPIRAYLRAGSTLFALTDRRAMVLTGARVKTFPIDRIEFVETESFADGSGHVEFYKDQAFPGLAVGNAPWAQQKFGFLAIADAERVARELLALQANPRLPAPGGAALP